MCQIQYQHPAAPVRTVNQEAPIGAAQTREVHVSTTHSSETEALLTPSEVATLFRVDPKTVTRWAKSGKLSSIRTLGGHRRYRESEVRELLNGVPQPRSNPQS